MIPFRRTATICTFIATALFAVAAAAGTGALLREPLPGEGPNLGIRFTHPNLSQDDIDISMLSGALEFTLSAPISPAATMLVKMPLARFDADVLDSETTFGNLFVGCQFVAPKKSGAPERGPGPRAESAAVSEIGGAAEPEPAVEAQPAAEEPSGQREYDMRNMTGFQFGIHLPTAGNDINAPALGFLTESHAVHKYARDIVTPEIAGFSRRSIGSRTSLEFLFGFLAAVPTESGYDTETMLRYDLLLRTQETQWALLAEISGLFFLSAEGADFSDRMFNTLAVGFEMSSIQGAPTLFAALPTNDWIDDAVDWNIGLRLQFGL